MLRYQNSIWKWNQSAASREKQIQSLNTWDLNSWNLSSPSRIQQHGMGDVISTSWSMRMKLGVGLKNWSAWGWKISSATEQVCRSSSIEKGTRSGIILFRQRRCHIWMFTLMNFIQAEIIRIIYFIRSIMASIRKWLPEQWILFLHPMQKNCTKVSA